MAMTDRECPACGKHALSIATRCPRCGQEFPARPVRWQATPDARRLPPLPTMGVILLLAAGLFSLVARRGLARDQEPLATGDVRGEASFALDTARAAAFAGAARLGAQRSGGAALRPHMDQGA
jgi:hypothetical protein